MWDINKMEENINQEVLPDHNHAPKYLTVYDAIRGDIILKKYPQGTYLPSEGQLTQIYGVSRNTIRHAIKLLADDGLVKPIQGSGIKVLAAREREAAKVWSSTFVAAEFTRPGASTVTAPAVEKIPASADIAEIFGLPVGTVIYRLQYIWKLDGEPYNYHIQYLNRTLMPGVHRYLDEGPNIDNLAREHWGLECNSIEEHISCKNAGFIEANLLGTEAGAAILYTTRITTCKEGVLEYSEHYGNPKLRKYMIKIR